MNRNIKWGMEHLFCGRDSRDSHSDSQWHAVSFNKVLYLIQSQNKLILCFGVNNEALHVNLMASLYKRNKKRVAQKVIMPLCLCWKQSKYVALFTHTALGTEQRIIFTLIWQLQFILRDRRDILNIFVLQFAKFIIFLRCTYSGLITLTVE